MPSVGREEWWCAIINVLVDGEVPGGGSATAPTVSEEDELDQSPVKIPELPSDMVDKVSGKLEGEIDADMDRLVELAPPAVEVDEDDEAEDEAGG
jgi:hypothetical protein